MRKQHHVSPLILCLGVLSMIFSLNYIVLAWAEPSDLPPSGNVAAPINVSINDQAKEGSLGIGKFFSVYGGRGPVSDPTFYISGSQVGIMTEPAELLSNFTVTGTTTFVGHVGIGVNNPLKQVLNSEIYSPLTVYQNSDSSDPNDITDSNVASFVRRYKNLTPDQEIDFSVYLYPHDPNGGTYLDRTAMLYAPVSPDTRVIQFSNPSDPVKKPSPIIRFNVGEAWMGPSTEKLVIETGKVTIGNFNNSSANSVKMDITGNVFASSSVGIGTRTPNFPLAIETDSHESPIAVRTTYRAVALPANQGLKSGIATITPTEDRAYFSFGCYSKNGTWYNDPFVWNGAVNRTGAKLAVNRSAGATWSAYTSNMVAADNTTITFWNIANIPLWNGSGTWIGKIKLTSIPTPLPLCNAANVGRVDYVTDPATGIGHFYGCASTGVGTYALKQLDN